MTPVTALAVGLPQHADEHPKRPVLLAVDSVYPALAARDILARFEPC
jgi:hypothetical protein